jgi:hypothetical protein
MNVILNNISTNKIKLKHLKNVKLSSNITCFKCSQCGETDEDIAEKYCGNVGCKYRSN